MQFQCRGRITSHTACNYVGHSTALHGTALQSTALNNFHVEILLNQQNKTKMYVLGCLISTYTVCLYENSYMHLCACILMVVVQVCTEGKEGGRKEEGGREEGRK